MPLGIGDLPNMTSGPAAFGSWLRSVALALMVAVLLTLQAGPVQAQSETIQELAGGLAGADFDQTAQIVDRIAATGNSDAVPLL